MIHGQPALLLSALVILGSAAAIAGVAAPIPNFHQVNENIFRGGQPGEAGWRYLAGVGVRIVLDLRRDGEQGHSIAQEARAVESAGMRYVSVPTYGIVGPRDADITRILALLCSGEKVFVHCREGKDRTGTAIACYRITRDHWANARAISEAKSCGMHWYEVGMRRYMLAFEPAKPASVAD